MALNFQLATITADESSQMQANDNVDFYLVDLTAATVDTTKYLPPNNYSANNSSGRLIRIKRVDSNWNVMLTITTQISDVFNGNMNTLSMQPSQVYYMIATDNHVWQLITSASV